MRVTLLIGHEAYRTRGPVTPMPRTGRLIPALCLAYAAQIGFAQSPDVIRVPVRIVTAPTAVVSARGQFVRDLQPRDFSLFDNDLRQSLRLDYVDEPVSLAVVIQTGDAVRA